MGVLHKTKTYLIGHMEFSEGRDWRIQVKNELEPRGIICIDPYHKPFTKETSEDELARKQLHTWMDNKQYDDVQKRMWKVRADDLRCCDLSDFIIARIIPDVASWGTAEELSTAISQKKVIFLIVEGGKKKTPLWLMGAIHHKYIYGNLEDALAMIKSIDDGLTEISSSRWKLLKPEYR